MVSYCSLIFCSGLGWVGIRKLAPCRRVAAHEVAEVFGKAGVGPLDPPEGLGMQFGRDAEADEGVGRVVLFVAHVCSLYFQSALTLQSKILSGGVFTPCFSKDFS
jgi:hypothetical protein